MINLVKMLQSQGVPIDGIGVQGHLIVGSLPGNIQSNLAAFAALGVEVALTELDISKCARCTYSSFVTETNAHQECQPSLFLRNANLHLAFPRQDPSGHGRSTRSTTERLSNRRQRL